MVYGEVVVSADHRTADIDSDLADTVPDRTVGIVLAEVDTDPAEVGIDPAEAGIDPVVVGTDPAEAGIDPAEAGTDPAEAGTDPAEAGTDPAEAGTDPAEAGIAPAEVDTDSAVFAVEKSSDFHNTGRNLFHLPLLNYN